MVGWSQREEGPGIFSMYLLSQPLRSQYVLSMVWKRVSWIAAKIWSKYDFWLYSSSLLFYSFPHDKLSMGLNGWMDSSTCVLLNQQTGWCRDNPHTAPESSERPAVGLHLTSEFEFTSSCSCWGDFSLWVYHATPEPRIHMEFKNQRMNLVSYKNYIRKDKEHLEGEVM